MNKIRLVLLPGMDGTGILFEPLLRSFPKDIKPLVISYPPDIPMTYEQLLPIVKGSLPKDGPYILLGESFSGPLAIMVASERPSNLKALILCGSFIKNPIPWLPGWSRHLALTPFFYLSRPFILAKALIAGYSSPPTLSLLRKAHAQVTPKVMAARAKAILGVNVEAALLDVTAPIFFLGGADDKVSPAGNLRNIMKVRQDVRATLIPGPHLILQIKPAESAVYLTNIINSIV